MNKTLKIANDYGSVDVRNGLSKKYKHIPGKRLQPLCRRLKITYAEALIGFQKSRFGYSPLIDGVVVSARSAPKLLAAIAEREEKAANRKPLTSEQKKARRQRQQKRDEEKLVAAIKECFPKIPDNEADRIARRACEIGSGRVGRTKCLHPLEAAELAVIAHVRHNYTDYDEILDDQRFPGMDEYERMDAREVAREAVSEQISEVLRRWGREIEEE